MLKSVSKKNSYTFVIQNYFLNAHEVRGDVSEAGNTGNNRKMGAGR